VCVCVKARTFMLRAMQIEIIAFSPIQWKTQWAGSCYLHAFHLKLMNFKDSVLNKVMIDLVNIYIKWSTEFCHESYADRINVVQWLSVTWKHKAGVIIYRQCTSLWQWCNVHWHNTPCWRFKPSELNCFTLLLYLVHLISERHHIWYG
jgi:hypothetical protein